MLSVAHTFVIIAVLISLKELYDFFAIGGAPGEAVDFNTLKSLLAKEDPDIVLVDVREKSEFKTGHIPGAINVPYLGSPGAFGLPPDEFEKRLGVKKPTEDQTLIFYCRSGTRSSPAARAASKFGYKKRMHYPGSFMEWKSLGGPSQRSR